jgi:hypothetical protein
MPDKFLAYSANYILNNCQSPLHHYAVVLPSQRASLFFRKHLSAQVEGVTFAPHIFTLDQFVGRYSVLKKADRIELLFDLYDCYLEVWKNKAEPLESFLKWGPAALADFNEVDAYLLDSEAFFKDLTNLKELDEWSLNSSELTDVQQNYAWFWKKLGALYHLFRQHLTNKGEAYQGLIFRTAAETTSQWLKNTGFEKIYFCGFSALSASEKKIMHDLTAAGLAEMIWDADQSYLDYPQHEAGLFIRQNLKDFDGSPHRIVDWIAKHPKEIVICSAPNELAQTDWLAGILSDSEDTEDTAVVLANEGLLPAVLSAIPQEINSINVSMGLKTTESPVHSLFILLFDWLKAHHDDGSFHYRHFVKLISHPYLNLQSDFTRDAQAVLNQIRSSGKVFLRAAEIATFAKNTRVAVFLEQMELLNELPPNPLRASLNIITYILNDLPAESRKFAFEKEYLFHYLKVLRRTDQLSAQFPERINSEAFHHIFLSLISAEKLNFVGEPLEGLQVMGMLETRALDFKRLIVLSCNEHFLPGSGQSQSLIPFELKKFHRLPTHREKEAIFAYHFYRLLQYPQQVYLSYSTDSDTWYGAEKSRYISQIKYDWPGFEHISISEHVLQTLNDTAQHGAQEIQKTPALIKAMKTRFEHRISPSALMKFMQCPLNFYYHQILGFRESEEMEETIEASTLGTVVHDVLEKLYTSFIKQGALKKDDIEAARKQAPELCNFFFEKHYPGDIQFGMNRLILEVTRKTVDRFLLAEIAEISSLAENNQGIEILELEAPLSTRFTVNTDGDELDITFFGKADRIDRVGNTLRVIDYKTGKVESGELKISDPESVTSDPKHAKALQLMLYAWLYRKSSSYQGPVMAGNVSMRNLKSFLIPVHWNKNNVLEDADFTEFESVLTGLLQQIFDPNVPFRHRPEARFCTFCEENTNPESEEN